MTALVSQKQNTDITSVLLQRISLWINHINKAAHPSTLCLKKCTNFETV